MNGKVTNIEFGIVKIELTRMFVITWPQEMIDAQMKAKVNKMMKSQLMYTPFDGTETYQL